MVTGWKLETVQWHGSTGVRIVEDKLIIGQTLYLLKIIKSK